MLHPLLVKINILELDNIDEACKKIQDLGLLTKKHDNLIIVKYPRELRHNENEYIRQSRGIIIDFAQKNIVNTSIPGSITLEEFKNIVPDFKDVVIEKCLDGTLLNLYYNNNKWNVSSKFSINADESRFRSSKTYRELLDEIVDINNLDLDKSFTYSLLLRHKDARNITPINRNRVIHLESTNNITGERVKIDIGLKSPGIIKFRDIINKLGFTSYDEVLHNLESKSWKNPGYMLYTEDRKFRVRLENPNYNKVRSMVENQSNIEYIILEYLYRDDIYELVKYFPEWKNMIINVNNTVTDYINEIHDCYVKNKIEKTLKIIEPKYRKPVHNLHSLYLSRKNEGVSDRILYRDVCELVRGYDTAYLYSILFKK